MYLNVVFGEQIALFKEFMVIVDPERVKTGLFDGSDSTISRRKGHDS